jgi:hypothetical protein
MFDYRECRPASPGFLPGAARVQFPTAGEAEFKSRPRDERGGRVCDCPTRMSGVRTLNEEQVMPVTSNTGNKKTRALVRPFHPAALRAGQPPETVRGGHHRQLAWPPVSVCS